MSKIVPKSMQSQSSQNIKTSQPRHENTEREVMFAALFGGATGKSLSDESVIGEESVIGKVSMTKMISADCGDENSFDEPISEDLMVLMASLHAGRGPGQKVAGPRDDALNDELELEQGPTLSDRENRDALALASSGALLPETPLLPETQSGLIKASRSGLADMVFEDGLKTSARAGSAAANAVPKNLTVMDGNSLLGQNKASIATIGSHQVPQNSVKVGENLGVSMENSVNKNLTNDLVKLQALRATNLEHQNAGIDKEVAKAELGELSGKMEKNATTAASQRQMVVTSFNPSLNVKLPSLREGGRTPNDVTRLTAATSTTLDNAQAITGTGANASLTGQSSAHTGHQGSAQAGSQSGGGLLSNLNNLQILDTAKDNWTEMLLQRVKSGLSSGKDQLDFQLNPRNLGKMRISLVMHNDRTNIQIQTETSTAASLLSDSETRLAQMLEASGLRLGNLNSSLFQGFGGAGSDQQANQQSHNKTGSMNQSDDVQDEVVDGLVAEGSDNLINIQA